MGHVSASHTTSALDGRWGPEASSYAVFTAEHDSSEDLLLSARYDFNIYSYASDLSFGIIYAPAVKQQAIKFRVGMEQVCEVLESEHINDITLTTAPVSKIGSLTRLGGNARPGDDIERRCTHCTRHA